MFHAGAVIPSSVFLLQLVTFAGGDFVPPSVALDELEPPVKVGLSARSLLGMAELLAVALLVPLSRVPELKAPYPFEGPV